MGHLHGRMKALTPLVYCEFRPQHEDNVNCAIFAGELVHGMAFCEGHAQLVTKAVEDSGVELVPTADVRMIKGGKT